MLVEHLEKGFGENTPFNCPPLFKKGGSGRKESALLFGAAPLCNEKCHSKSGAVANLINGKIWHLHSTIYVNLALYKRESKHFPDPLALRSGSLAGRRGVSCELRAVLTVTPRRGHAVDTPEGETF